MTQRLWLSVAIFVVVTAVVSAVGFWLHVHFAIAYWVFDLGSFGPLAGGLAVLALNKPLRLGARWVPGLGFNSQVIRRTVLMIAVALAIVLTCVQFYSFFRWRMKPIDLPDVPHPLAMPGDSATIVAFVALAMLIGLVMQEFGFRTVLEPTIRRGQGVVVTGVIVGVIWGLWAWPAWQAALQRFDRTGALVGLVLFLGAHFVMTISVSVMFVIFHRKMNYGHWVSAVAFRLVYGLGFFLILDEEQGQWQAMFAISLACAAAAAVGLYYYRRAVLAERVRPARDQNAGPGGSDGAVPLERSSQRPD
ncbi:MAG: hypothetical protein Q4F67_03950 [Propionibacteriaceae bacterium]|nr:hypothetical protein [Propionibacteriaceae bacterium]